MLDTWVVVACLSIFSILRIPSLIEPSWYGDEGVYQVIGKALLNGRFLYKEIWDNKPPLLYLYYALVNSDLFLIRLLSLLFGAGAIVVFFFLAKKLLKNNFASYVSTFLYAVLFGLPFLEGNIANSENFMHLPILGSLYLLVSSDEKKRKNLYYLCAGFLLSVAFLTKIVAVFDFGAFVAIIFFIRIYEKKQIVKRFLGLAAEEILFAAGFFLPIILVMLYFFAGGVFADFYKAVFSQNVGYVGSGNYFLFPMGMLFLKLGLLIFSLLIFLKYFSFFKKSAVIILVWLAFSMFDAFFSNRPYTHYVLTLLPSFMLLVGLVFSEKKRVMYALISFVVTAIVLNTFHGYTKIGGYYLNYLSFVFGNKSIDAYRGFFDSSTPRDYEIARFFKTKAKDSNIFIWGDSPQIYYLAGKLPPGRYTVAYHITFYKDAVKETINDLKKSNVKFIVKIKDDPTIDAFLTGYTLRYKIRDAKIYEREI